MASSLNKPALKILQWNCRGLAKRRGELLARVSDPQYAFDILLLQETHTDTVQLSGYDGHHNPTIEHKLAKKRHLNPPTPETVIRAQAGVYVRRNMPHVKLDTAAWCTPIQEVTAVRIALDGTERRLLVVSAYCRPYTGKTTTCDFSWMKTLRDAYPTDYTVFGGDLNTHYEAWSSCSTTQRGHDLSSALESTDLAIVNDLNRPTRYGTNTRQSDSVLDLTLASPHTAGLLTWTILDEDAWGSDHFPIVIEIPMGKRKRTTRSTTTVIWDRFRKTIEDKIPLYDTSAISTLLTTAATFATETREVCEGIPTPDTHLLSLWERRTKALTKYRSTKRQCYLHRGSSLTREADKYVNTLRLERWIAHCESFDKSTQLSTVWSTFNAMYGKRTQTHTVPVVALFSDESTKDILDKLRDSSNTIAYTDAACHSSGASAVAAVFSRPHPTSLDSPSTYTKTYNSPSSPELAEERAVLLALRTHETHAREAPDLAPRDGTLTIYTDSQYVVRALKKQHLTHSPTVSGIFQTALDLYRNYAIRTCIRWIPGHAGVTGNERAHGAAMEEMNKPQLAPFSQCPTSLSLPPSPDSTADETAYDPDDEMRLLKQQWRHRLASSWTPEQFPIPGGVFRRSQIVLLRRIRTGGALTPYLLQLFDTNRKRKADPYYPTPDPSCQRCKDPESLPKLYHLIWDCAALAAHRTASWYLLPDDERPTCYDDWVHPPGDCERRTRILTSLLDFVSRSGLATSV
ncbi:hypothetical protein HPB47_010811 [Ixodes persulcatus]|uniref:Uncharacterized protein n=1 Tax=Ixodes persulcatus TaxID=34615 RepID=A0AC60NXZ8_IXOPE|nr:hypothetical protein HPB47_010811 [Ixodes persulcatus]